MANLEELLKSKSTEEESEINVGHWHEFVDRLECFRIILEGTLLAHPIADEYPYFEEKLQNIQEAIGDLYQDAGYAWSKFEETN